MSDKLKIMGEVGDHYRAPSTQSASVQSITAGDLFRVIDFNEDLEERVGEVLDKIADLGGELLTQLHNNNQRRSANAMYTSIDIIQKYLETGEKKGVGWNIFCDTVDRVSDSLRHIGHENIANELDQLREDIIAALQDL